MWSWADNDFSSRRCDLPTVAGNSVAWLQYWWYSSFQGFRITDEVTPVDVAIIDLEASVQQQGVASGNDKFEPHRKFEKNLTLYIQVLVPFLGFSWTTCIFYTHPYLLTFASLLSTSLSILAPEVMVHCR